MENRIETLDTTLICGKSLKMSIQNDRTRELWQSFMPLLRNIDNRQGTHVISLQVFEKPFDPKKFDPATEFTKWAAVPVSVEPKRKKASARPGVFDIQTELNVYEISGGLYAVFTHIGPASAFKRSMDYIYGTWFPASDYQLDDREHFEILPQGYHPEDLNAREEIWIPVRKKNS